MPEPDRGHDDPVAIVTGGGSGIGRASAVQLAENGHRCVLIGRREEVLTETSASLPTSGSHIALDITDVGAAEKVVTRTLEEHGRIDVLVHAAGVFEKRGVGETDTDFWSSVIDLNLGAVMELTRAAWSALCDVGGQVVLVSSIAAVQGFPGNAAYAASKGGMNALGEVLRLEGREHGVRVLTVCPGQTDTDIWNGKAPSEVRERMMDPASIGGLIAALVALDRAIDIEPVVIRPMLDPWTAGGERS
jgi:NADP-dependent 3-hydroxy acid dehydrogenase YdfG